MPRKPRRLFTSEQLAAILRRQFVDKVPVSQLCEEYERQPSVFYYWQNQALVTSMMLDADVVAGSSTTTWRVLNKAGVIDRWKQRPSGKGFDQPLEPHQRWHVVISYVNVAGTFSYLCSILDGCSRFLVHWELREAMKEADVERVIERAREMHPGVSPRII